ncbi:Zn(II)2Cys6 transcription factor domain-containing protein [Aspergillus stella-maris]|uniref:Zn(II)2Cys6 transcription factor domain-containing protein n=1 Tax=Aspergillus stella-maris TaxID=1810926 RepID=UPI003CCE0819
MTFCCRPSQNCQRCRERRLKCDRVRPGCTQCKRAHKECAGYREEISLLFRNENERIIRRSKVAHERSRKRAEAMEMHRQSSSPRSESSKSSGSGSSDDSFVLSRRVSTLSVDIDVSGLQFFFQHFSNKALVEKGFQCAPRRHMFVDIENDTSLRNAVISVGLAALANVNRDRALLSVARQRYGMALTKVRSVVDELPCGGVGVLLKMIVMLAIFEMVDAKTEMSTSWAIHLTGISALLQQTPFPQGMEFTSQAQLWFYLAVIVNYFQVGGPFPAALSKWRIQRRALLASDARPAFELIDILVKLVQLCSRGQESSAEEVLCEAVELEIELELWMQCLPPKWSFSIQQTENVPGTFYGQYHVYQDPWAPRVLNHYQLGRLLINEVIVAYASLLGDVEQEAHALSVIDQMATDICVGVATQDLLGEQCELPMGGIPRPLLKGVFVTIYPLTVAGSATGVSDKLRNWVIETLQRMNDRTGIRQALNAIPRIQLAACQTRPAGFRPMSLVVALAGQRVDDLADPNGVWLAPECPGLQERGLAAARIRV